MSDEKGQAASVGSGALLGAPMSGKTHVMLDWLNSPDGRKTVRAWKRDFAAQCRRSKIVVKLPSGNWDKGYWVSA